MSCVKTPKIDLSDMSCLEQCKQLYNAYMRMIMGGQKTQVRHGDFWIEYRANTDGDMDRLKSLYETIRSGCPACQSALPSFNSASSTQRGRPARLKICG